MLAYSEASPTVFKGIYSQESGEDDFLGGFYFFCKDRASGPSYKSRENYLALSLAALFNAR